ncbi:MULTISPECIES: ComEA family DNA-binding protein [Tsukamurella]|uniref:ComEA family DNA-binding protein n=2 Tax=Tsukamurella TaxID=2060 RepID=A0A5C5S564_9ACTN|nr:MULTISPECIES: ComEA family DNA-binding protein [Tsukamurella]NMD54836.1 ComEA family DNA-binding protein [Tsukamurella columbiensis]TWS29625.1 ComEA family DNA-binding protein [Tsukamurella conjunctivitidis]
MNGEREGDPGTGAADDQIFARPAWLDEFTPDRGDGHGDPERRDDAISPSRRVRVDDDFWDDEEPSGWRSTVEKVRTTPRAALALVAVGLIAAVVAAIAVLGPARGSGAGQHPIVDFAGASSSVAPSAAGAPTPALGGGSATAAPSAAPSEMVVAVVGLVRTPGLHRLRPGARVADALTAARGTLGGADTASLNLAQQLRDGDQVVVGVVDPKAGVTLRSSVRSGPGAAGASAPEASGVAPAGATGAAAAGAVNINTAGATELDRLPGVGAATAAAIIAYRDKNGPFRTVDDLGKVSGIGDAKLAKIKSMATV